MDMKSFNILFYRSSLFLSVIFYDVKNITDNVN